MNQTTLTLLTGLIGLVSAIMLAVLQIKRADRERYEKTLSDWSEVHRLNKEHIDSLERHVQALQEELTDALEKVTRLTTRAETWNQRNAELWISLKDARSRLRDLGEDPGPEPNGHG